MDQVFQFTQPEFTWKIFRGTFVFWKLMKICKKTKQFYLCITKTILFLFFCLLFLILNFYWAVCFTWNLFFCCELFAVIKFSQGCRYFGNWYKNYGRKSIKKYMFSLVSIAYYVLHCSILYNRSSLYIVNFLRIWFLIKSNICEIDCIGFQKLQNFA